MTVLQLKKALSSVDWNAGVLNFSNDANTMEKFDKGCARIAEWVRGLASADAGNPALAFLWSAQTAANTAVVSSSLSLYHAAAASIRNVVENGLYYSYFRSHPAELATLVRDKSFYISKADVIAFYRLHIPEFKSIQEKLGLQSRLENWYSDISAIVHGQLPGVWVHHVAIKDINPNQATQGEVLKQFQTAEQILHDILLATVAQEMWDKFTASTKRALLSGMSGDLKTILKLDRA